MYLTAAEIKKQREREARIKALVDDVDWWDKDRVTDKAKAKVKEELEQLSDVDLLKTYNEEFSEED